MKKPWVVVVIVIAVVVIIWLVVKRGPGAVDVDESAEGVRSELRFADVRQELAGAAGLSAQELQNLLQKFAAKVINWEGWVVRVDAAAWQVMIDMDAPGTDDKPELLLHVMQDEMPALATGDKVRFVGRLANPVKTGEFQLFYLEEVEIEKR